MDLVGKILKHHGQTARKDARNRYGLSVRDIEE